MYQMKTTFWSDFAIAEKFGIAAVEETYRRCFKEWKTYYVYLTELAIVCNWLCWSHWEKGHDDLSELYSTLYYKTRDYALSHLKGSELSYYIRTTD